MVAAPQRGFIYETNFAPSRGSEQAGTRPALVIQNDVGNAHSPVTIVAAVTSAVPKKHYPQDVWLPDGTLPKRSIVKCNQLLTIDKARLGRLMGAADEATMKQIDQALRYSLALDDSAC